MRTNDIYRELDIDQCSSMPKYQQLANSFIKAISMGRLLQNDKLPTIKALSCECKIATETAENAYKYLKRIGLVGSFPGKGYFIKHTDTAVQQKFEICLLFNKLSVHKKNIYDALVAELGDAASIDLYIYNSQFALFKQLILQKKNYSHYVIMPHFVDSAHEAKEIINTIPKEKLILLDRDVPGITGEYAAVYENFENDIFSSLKKAAERLSRYHTIKLIFPEYSYLPLEIIKGFKRFCQEFGFNGKVIHNISEEPIQQGEVYINLSEDDLITLLERIISLNLVIGKQVGVISYNETPLKKIILNGITTISSDFTMMGQQTARLIMEGTTKHVEIPFRLTLRPSL